MLIVAIPKSASTSLLDTLGKLHKKPAKQKSELLENFPKTNEFAFLPNYHRDMKEIDKNITKILEDKNHFYKQHIIPTVNNLNLLKNVKKVILLRDAEDVIYAYMREKNKFHDMYKRKEFKNCKTSDEWLNRAKEIGLYDDLVKFNQLWVKDNSDKLIIKYNDLIKNPKNTINRIENYFNLPISNSVKLSKKRYTR